MFKYTSHKYNRRESQAVRDSSPLSKYGKHTQTWAKRRCWPIISYLWICWWKATVVASAPEGVWSKPCAWALFVFVVRECGPIFALNSWAEMTHESRGIYANMHLTLGAYTFVPRTLTSWFFFLVSEIPGGASVMGYGRPGGLRPAQAAELPGHRRHTDVFLRRLARLAGKHPGEVDPWGKGREIDIN